MSCPNSILVLVFLSGVRPPGEAPVVFLLRLSPSCLSPECWIPSGALQADIMGDAHDVSLQEGCATVSGQRGTGATGIGDTRWACR